MSQQDTVTVPAAELQDVLTTADATMKKYAAENASLKEQVAALTQKRAADEAAVKEATAAAVKALVDNKLIAPHEVKVAEERCSTLAGALGVLAKTASLGERGPKAIGKPEPRAKTASDNAERGARMTDLPEVRTEVNDNYLAALGIQ